MLENNDPGYHEYTDEELVMHVREESEEKNKKMMTLSPRLFLMHKPVRHWKQFLHTWSSNLKYQ